MGAIMQYLRNYFEKREPRDKVRLDAAIKQHDKSMEKLQTQKDELTAMLDRMVRKRRARQ